MYISKLSDHASALPVPAQVQLPVAMMAKASRKDGVNLNIYADLSEVLEHNNTGIFDARD